MNLQDYPPTARPIDPTTRPRAAQDIASRRRRDTETYLATPTPRFSASAGALVLLVLLFVGLLSYGLSARPMAVTPAQAFDKTRHQASPAPTSAAATPKPTRIPPRPQRRSQRLLSRCPRPAGG